MFPTVQQRVLLHSIIIIQPVLKGRRCLCDLCALHRLYLEDCSGRVCPELPQCRGAVRFLSLSLNGSAAAPALLGELRVLAGAAKSSLGKENQGQASRKVAVASSEQNQ